MVSLNSKLGCEEDSSTFVFIPAVRPLPCTIPVEWYSRGCQSQKIQCEWCPPESFKAAILPPFRIGNWSPERLNELSNVTQQGGKKSDLQVGLWLQVFLLSSTCDLDYSTRMMSMIGSNSQCQPCQPVLDFGVSWCKIPWGHWKIRSSLCHGHCDWVWLSMCYTRDIILWKRNGCTSQQIRLWRQWPTLPLQKIGLHEYSITSTPKSLLYLLPVLSSYHNRWSVPKGTFQY